MKKFIAILFLAGAFTVATQAQTNIAYRITVDGVNTSWSYDAAGSKKDVARIDGIKFAYNVYTNSLATNVVALAIGPWLKQQHVVLIDDYSAQKQKADNATILAKLISLLTLNADLLSASDLSSLTTIANKAP